jgi:hypothetical protein
MGNREKMIRHGTSEYLKSFSISRARGMKCLISQSAKSSYENRGRLISINRAENMILIEQFGSMQ